ncbi:MAG: M3 family oligoendopeptidase [Bacteroidetes bacterium]|nr:M3 family oligoendopeptidase [Bacteroidota bacterium]
MNNKTTGAENIRWDLTHLYSDASVLKDDLNDLDSLAQTFNQRWIGKIGTLTASQLNKAIIQYEDLQERIGRASTYAYLNWSTATNDSQRGALLQYVREATTQIRTRLIFFEVEWLKVEDAYAEKMINDPALNKYKHYLERERLFKDYTLSESEETIMAEMHVTGRSAWMRYFSETMSQMRFNLRGENLTQEHLLARLYTHDRELRKEASESFTQQLIEKQHSLTFIFNTLLADKASNDRIRGLTHWLQTRNLGNEIADETADALIHAVTNRYDLSVRFYQLKGKILGLTPLHDYDRYAPIDESDSYYSWDDACSITIESYGDFHPVLAEVAERFFTEQWIHAPVQEGKQGGAFSHGAVPSVHPYVLVNYTARARDVQTLAHELGHGVHQFLSRGQGYLQASTPLTTAETASVFGEMLTFQRILAHESVPNNRLALLIGKIDDTMATVFRQVSMNRFENAVHTARREEGELSAETFGDVWMATQSEMFSDSVKLTEQYRHWWSYIPHFLHTPGYVYAYAFGELLVLALYARYLEFPEEFPDLYIELMQAGGSDWPHSLVERLGLNLQDPDFWDQGLGAVEQLIEEAETIYNAYQSD